MSNLNEQKCPACLAPMRFDPASGKMVCDYCGTTVEIEAAGPAPKETAAPKTGGKAGRPGNRPASAMKPAAAAAAAPAAVAGQQAAGQQASGQLRPGQTTFGTANPGPAKPAEEPETELEGFDFASLTDQAIQEDAEDLPVYNCVSCGAELIVPAAQTALTCPYCGNNITLTNQLSGKLRPDGVIPFRIQSKDLPASVRRFYKGKKLIPKRFFSESTMGLVSGVYVPFWVFNGELSGRLYYTGEKSKSHRHGDYIIYETDHYDLTRDAALAFDNLPVDASGRMDDSLMDSLEPFDLSDVRPFDTRYLAGFTADRFDQPKSKIAGKAEGRMRKTASTLISAQASAGYSNVTARGGRVNASLDAKYILFPVYLFDIKWGNLTYHYAVNGQTGKVVGQLPDDSGTSAMYFLKRAGITAGALVAFSIVKYFLGG